MKMTALRVVAMAALVMIAFALGWHSGWRRGVIELLRQDEIMLTYLEDITRVTPPLLSRELLLAAPHKEIVDLEQMRLRDRQSLLTHPFSRQFRCAAIEPIPRLQREELAHIQRRLAELDPNPLPNTAAHGTR